MHYFKNFFKTKEPSVSFLRNIKGISYIVANCVLGDWNDPSMLLKDRSIILDVVSTDENRLDKISLYNKMYYDQIYRFYSLSYNQLLSISDIIDISPKESREVYRGWPKTMSRETYNELNKRLKLEFVSEIELQQTSLPAYVISINMDFWSTTNDPSFFDVTLNTYEKKYLPEEMIHADYPTAVMYAVIITNRLIRGEEPAEGAFTEKMLDELRDILASHKDPSQVEKLISEIETNRLPYFDFLNVSYSGAYELSEDEVLYKVRNEYNKLYYSHKEEFERLVNVYSLLKHPPFFINCLA